MAIANKQFKSSHTRFNAHGVIETPDGRSSFASKSGKASAAIEFACVNGQTVAEYRFRFLCGRFQGSTLPISAHSKVFKTQAEAISDAASRLLVDLRAKCGNPEMLPAAQRKELAAMVAWAEALLIAKNEVALPLAGKKFIDLFAGIGGFHIAAKQNGARCVAAVERDAAAAATYRANHGDSFPLHNDIRDVDADALPDCHLVFGGFPCKSFSIAGGKEGFAHPENGGLFFEIIRIAKARQPELIVLENVKAFATHDGGKTCDQALDALANIGYATSVQIMDSSDFGVPQKRERLFLVAHRLDKVRAGEKPFVFPTATDATRVVDDILEPNIKTERCKAKMTPKKAASERADAPYQVGLIDGRDSQGYRVYSTKHKGVTLCASSGGVGGKTGLYLVNGKPRRLTTRECARMQGFPETFIPNPSADQARKQFGNSVAVPLVAAIINSASSVI